MTARVQSGTRRAQRQREHTRRFETHGIGDRADGQRRHDDEQLVRRRGARAVRDGAALGDDALAYGEAGDVRADLDDVAGNVAAEDEGVGGDEQAGGLLDRVGRVDGHGAGVDEDFGGARVDVRGGPDADGLGWAVEPSGEVWGHVKGTCVGDLCRVMGLWEACGISWDARAQRGMQS